MRNVLILVFAASFLSVGCAKTDPANVTNSAKVNAAVVSSLNANQEIAAKPANTPLPAFTDANEAISVGDKLFDASANEKAIEAYRQAVKLNPDFADAYFKLGLAYSQLEVEQREAGTLPEESPTPALKGKKPKKEPTPKQTDANKAFENAVKAYKKILDKNPKDDAAQFNLGRAYNKLDQDTDAQKALAQAVKLKPDDGQYQTEYGAILIKLAKYEDAISPLKKAVNIDAENMQAQDLLEKAQAGKKRIDFGIKPKLDEMAQEQQQQQQVSKKRGLSKKDKKSDSLEVKPKTAATPEKKNANQQL